MGITSADIASETDRFMRDALAHTLTQLNEQQPQAALTGTEQLRIHHFTAPRGSRVAEMGYSKNGAQVFDLAFSTETGILQTTPVIVKRLDKAGYASEVAAYTRIASAANDINIFAVPAAFSAETGGYLVTKVVPQLIPMSNLLQSAFRNTDDPDTVLKQFSTLAQQGSSALRQLHRIGIKHDDMQPKNLGIDAQTGSVYVYDFEKSQLTDSVTEELPLVDSMEEISEFLEVLTFIALEGYSPDDISAKGVSSETYKHQRRIQLAELGLEQGQFKEIATRTIRDIANSAKDTAETPTLTHPAPQSLPEVILSHEAYFDNTVLNQSGALGLDAEALTRLQAQLKAKGKY